MKSLENKLISKIYGKGRGWSFSRKDFSLLGSAESIDKGLFRLAQKGTIRRLTRGLYDYPRYSKWLQQELGPDMDQVAHALARKFGWSIQVTGNAALNILGISTQVPTRFIYLSDGPSRTYSILDNELTFRKSRFAHLNLKHTQSALLVQAIEALGQKSLTQENLTAIARYLSPHGPLPERQRQRIAKDTQFVTSWIQETITVILNMASKEEAVV
ncbi:MAG: DUF6088 family protein [Marinobacter sp.]